MIIICNKYVNKYIQYCVCVCVYLDSTNQLFDIKTCDKNMINK